MARPPLLPVGHHFVTGLLLLTASTGCIDAVSYLALDKVFTGNMTGNVLFIGFSLLDYNLRLLIKKLRWRIYPAKVPDAYSVDCKTNALVLPVWQSQRRYGKFIEQDARAVVPAVHAVWRRRPSGP